MKIQHAKSIKIQSQPAFAGDKPQETHKQETPSNTGKILLTLGALGALGGGAYLIMKKGKVDATKAEDTAIQVKTNMYEHFDKLKTIVNEKTHKNLDSVVTQMQNPKSTPIRTINVVAKDTEDARELAQGIANSAGYDFREFTPKGKTPQDLAFEHVRLLGEASQKFEKTGQKTVIFSPDAEAAHNFMSADHKNLSEAQRAELGAILGEEKSIKQNKDAATLIIPSDKKIIHDRLTPVVYSKNIDETKIFDRSQEAFKKATEDFQPLLDSRRNYLEKIGEQFRHAHAFNEYAPSAIQIDAATNAQAKDIARLLPDYLMAERSTITSRQRHPKRLLQTIQNALDVREELFSQTGKREILHIGDLSQIFDEAKKKFSDKKFYEFSDGLNVIRNRISEKGLSISYTISDIGKVPLVNRVMDSGRVVAKGSTYDNLVPYKTTDKKVSEDAISSISEHLDLKSTSKLRILARQFNKIHESGLDSTKLRGALIVQRSEKNASAAIVAKLPEITGARLVKLDVDAHLDELEEYAYNKVYEAEMHHEKTGQATLLHIVARGGNKDDNKTIETVQKYNFHNCLPVIETSEKALPETLSTERRIQI